MCGFRSFSLQRMFLGLLVCNVCFCMFHMEISVLGSFMWLYVLLYLLDGKESCWGFQVATCAVVCFMWQCVLLGLLGVNLCCWVFYVAICIVGSFRRQCVLLGLLGGNMY